MLNTFIDRLPVIPLQQSLNFILFAFLHPGFRYVMLSCCEQSSFLIFLYNQVIVMENGGIMGWHSRLNLCFILISDDVIRSTFIDIN